MDRPFSMKNPNRRTRHKSSRFRTLLSVPNTIALLFLISCAIVAWWLLTQSSLTLSSPAQFVQSIKALGGLGIVLYIGFLIIAIVIGPIPSTPITIAAGAVWGPLNAGFYGVIGLSLGSLAAYLLGRTLGRSVVKAFIGKVIYLSNHRGDMYLGWIVFITHLFPFLPYDLISYGAGLSGMSLSIFAVANLLGLIPNTFFLTYMGSAFTIGFPLAIGLVLLFLSMLVIIPWGIKRHNWLGIRDVIRIE